MSRSMWIIIILITILMISSYWFSRNKSAPPWVKCKESLFEQVENDTVTISSNGIPNHDLESGPGCCASAQSYTWIVPRSPTNDTTGGHNSANCPEANGDYRCADDR